MVVVNAFCIHLVVVDATKYSNNNEPIPIQGIPFFKYDLFNDPF